MRKINDGNEKIEMLYRPTCTGLNTNLKTNKNQPTNNKQINASANIFSQLVLHKLASKLKIDRNIYVAQNNEVVFLMDPERHINWAGTNNGKPSGQVQLGIEAGNIKMINGMIFERTYSVNGVFIKCYRETNTKFFLKKENGELEVRTAEVKCRNQLGMCKGFFFNARYFQILVKSIVTNNFSCFILIQDERYMDYIRNGGKIEKPLKLLFWDDIRLLAFQSCIEAFEKCYKQIKDVLTKNHGTVKGIKIEENSTHFSIVGLGKDIKLSEFARLPSDFPTLKSKTNTRTIVIGDGIPSYEYELTNNYVRFNCMNDWFIKDGSTEAYFIAKTNDDILKILSTFTPFTQRKTPMDMFVWTTEPIKEMSRRKFDELKNKDKNIRNINYETFKDDNELGRWLKSKGMTVFDKPIEHTLLLLGENERIPQEYIIAGLSFLKMETAKSFDFSLFGKLERIGAIGTLRECKIAKSIVDEKSREIHFHGFTFEKSVVKDGIHKCTKNNLVETMKKRGFPIMKEFAYEKNRYLTK